MFFATEAFFGGAGHDFPIDEQNGCRIVSLRNAVLALLQAGPVGLLERNGIFKPTYAQNFRHYPVSPLQVAGKSTLIAAVHAAARSKVQFRHLLFYTRGLVRLVYAELVSFAALFDPAKPARISRSVRICQHGPRLQTKG